MRQFGLIYSFFLVLLLPFTVMGQEDTLTKVMVLEIKGPIDPRMSRYVELGLKEADKQKAEVILVDMDTYGGTVDDADKIRTMLLQVTQPTYVLIDKNAASAGALIALACDSIYMASGANIGAATVVNGQQQAMPDKYQSYMRSMMRSTAEANGRDPKIAEAMVDESLEVEGISDAGKVLTFTTQEAMQFGFCEGQQESLKGVLTQLDIPSYELTTYHLTVAERVIAFFMNPLISGVLILVILGGIYFELQTPGVGFPIAAAILAAIFYFTPYYLNGLAANWEIILFFVGLLLLALEAFVIPGFGVAGVSGLICTIGGLVLVMLNNDWLDFTFVSSERIVEAIVVAMSGFVFSVAGAIALGSRLLTSPMFKRIALEQTFSKEEGYTSDFLYEHHIGSVGVAHTVLRPSGKVMINGDLYDAFTRGGYIDKGEKVEVVEQTGAALKVQKLAE
ncbi:NfeD family protein [Algivirga pacifica]|uniref:NfeD family protein n=1 Tax=Algivirga pacifica TaxID=1162670 RepID=A0ABP9D902_9BACT